MAGLNKWDVLDRIGWEPHPGQLEVAECPARHRVVSAGRRFGKSDLGGHEVIPEALATYFMRNSLLKAKKRREVWVVGPEYSDSEKEFRVVWNELKALEVPFDKPGTYNNPDTGLMHISLWDGTFQFAAKSAKHPESLVGEGLVGVVMAEAAKLKERVWTKFVRPMLVDFNGWSLHTSTPEGKNWFHENWRRGQDPANKEWASWRMPSWTNPYVYKTETRTHHVKMLYEMMRLQYSRPEPRRPEELIERYKLKVDPEILSLILDLTEETFNQEIGADFTEYVGKVFKSFDEEIHVTDLERRDGWDLVGAVDYGFTNPNVWLLVQIGPWGEIEVLNEVYEVGLSPEEFAKEILRRGLCPTGVRTFYPDPASPGDTRVLENRLRVRASGNTGGEIKWRVDAIREALKVRDRQPLLTFDRKCIGTIADFEAYRYPERRVDSNAVRINALTYEKPLDKDNHGPEALGRFMRGYFGTAEQLAGTRRTRALNMRSKDTPRRRDKRA